MADEQTAPNLVGESLSGDVLPAGARYAGTYRVWLGSFLCLLFAPIAMQGLMEDGVKSIPVVLFGFVLFGAPAFWGLLVKRRRIVRMPLFQKKSLTASPVSSDAVGEKEEPPADEGASLSVDVGENIDNAGDVDELEEAAEAVEMEVQEVVLPEAAQKDNTNDSAVPSVFDFTPYVGTIRMWGGFILSVVLVFQFPKGVAEIGIRAIPTLLFGLALFGGVAYWGYTLRAKRILRTSKTVPVSEPLPVQRNFSLLEQVEMFGEKGRLELYSREEQLLCIRELTLRESTDGRTGVYVGQGHVIPEPNNSYDPHAIQVWVEGMPVGYFALEWKERAHAQVRADNGKPTIVPVVLRLWKGRTIAWVMSSDEDAEGFAEWLERNS